MQIVTLELCFSDYALEPGSGSRARMLSSRWLTMSQGTWLRSGKAVGCAMYSLMMSVGILFFYDSALRPMIEPISVVRKKSRQNVAGSLKMKMPMTTAPTAPMPVHTG